MLAYLFDVDGVLTNPQTRNKITKPELITMLINKLNEGSPLGFISGRGMLWLRSSVVKVLENYLMDHPGFAKSILDNIYVAGEFGGVTCIHTNGQRQETVNNAWIIPEEIRRGLHLVSFQFSDYVSVETEKQTIFTVFANQNITEEDFQTRKNVIVEEFQHVLEGYPDLEVQADRLAINIRYKKANKKNATDMFLQWLKEKGFTPEKYYVFGDSPTDLEMGEELQRQKIPFAFIYVGEQSELTNSHHTFPLTVTKGHCDEGTVEYLKEQE
jgi:hydroxymethylpyrimidine pyrophosphatase-like HAD family hydrolase